MNTDFPKRPRRRIILSTPLACLFGVCQTECASGGTPGAATETVALPKLYVKKQTDERVSPPGDGLETGKMPVLHFTARGF